MEARLRTRYTNEYTTFALSLKPMLNHEFDGHGIDDADGRRVSDGRKFTKGERGLAKQLMVREEMAVPDKKAHKKAYNAAQREEMRPVKEHEAEHGCGHSC